MIAAELYRRWDKGLCQRHPFGQPLAIIALLLLAVNFSANSQEYFWVSFTDKNNSEYSLSSPERYLSARAISRRAAQSIPIDSLDLPVNSNYLSGVLQLGAELVHTSKWLNGITVKADSPKFEFKAKALPFVKDVQLTKTNLNTKSAIHKFREMESADAVPIDTSAYGPSVYQTAVMNGQYLHTQGFKGQGMLIAVLDGGFYKANSYAAFDSLWANNQILGTKDFVDPKSDFFSTNYHGMSVLSCMGGNVPGKLVGTAPKASYWLLRTEDVPTEFLIEEDNWVAAAEFADSVGADIINSSLGYYEFDDPRMNHTFADMDGKTTRVTRGANFAASRGMLVFSSAGNERNNKSGWRQIIAPSDGDLVIGIGAVNRDSIPAGFTSLGPASDGDVKPNVAGLGWNTFLQKSGGDLGYLSGTSFSSPIVAGMGACLWQAVPSASAGEVKQAIEQSAHLYSNPDSLLGYGIPDFKTAYLLLTKTNISKIETKNQWTVYPNPVGEFLMLRHNSEQHLGEVHIEMYSMGGRLLQKWTKVGSGPIELSNLQTLPSGVLLLKITSGASTETFKLAKTR